MKKTTIKEIRFGAKPSVFRGMTKHYGTTEDGINVTFYMDPPLKDGEQETVLYYKPHTNEAGEEIEEKDNYGNLKLKAPSLEPIEDKPQKTYNKNYGGKSGKGSYNAVQERRQDYEENVRDPKLTVQGLMSNYTQIAVAALKSGKSMEDAEKICDWTFDKAAADAVKLQKLINSENE